jgi:hypothetical protein
MAEIVRLKKWRTILMDGKSWLERSVKDKSEVAVFVHVGFEPLRPSEDQQDCLNVDDVVLDMAEHIKRARKQGKQMEKA